MSGDSASLTATERHLGWGRIAAGASLLIALGADVLGGFGWFEAVVASAGAALLVLGLVTLVTSPASARRTGLANRLRWADLAIFAFLVAAGPDEDAGYVLVLLILMLMLTALRGAEAFRTAVVVGVVAEGVRQLLHPVVGVPVDVTESVVGVGLAVAVSAPLARMVDLARTSEQEARRSAQAATTALAEAELAAAQLDVLHRVVVSTIGAREADALQKMVTEVASYLDIGAVTVVMLDAAHRPRVIATTDPEVAGRDDVAPITRGPFLGGPLARALDGRASRATPEELARIAASDAPTRDDISVHPLRRADGSVVGALACATHGGRVFGPTEDRTLARFADQMSLAIEAARSLDREADLAAQYRELDRLKTDFIAITSHELRTPLTTVVGVVETIRQRMGELSHDEMERLVGAVARQSQRLSRLVDDLSTVSRVDAGTLVTMRRPTDVAGVVREAIATLPDVDAVVHADDVTATAAADPDRLLQVMTNLLANGEQHGQGTVHVAVADEGEVVVVRVWDDGPGIPTHRRDEVFERFVRLGDTESHSRGSGLGLAIARELVVAMGGTIAVVEHLERNAFEIRLLAAPPA